MFSALLGGASFLGSEAVELGASFARRGSWPKEPIRGLRENGGSGCAPAERECAEGHSLWGGGRTLDSERAG